MNAGFFSSLENVSSVRAPRLYETTDKPRVEAGAEPGGPARLRLKLDWTVESHRTVLEGPFTEESLCEFSRNAQALTNKDKDFLRPGQQVDRLARGSSVSPFIQ